MSQTAGLVGLACWLFEGHAHRAAGVGGHRLPGAASFGTTLKGCE